MKAVEHLYHDERLQLRLPHGRHQPTIQVAAHYAYGVVATEVAINPSQERAAQRACSGKSADGKELSFAYRASGER